MSLPATDPELAPSFCWAIIRMPPGAPFREADAIRAAMGQFVQARYLIEIRSDSLTLHLFAKPPQDLVREEFRAAIRAALKDAAEAFWKKERRRTRRRDRARLTEPHSRTGKGPGN